MNNNPNSDKLSKQYSEYKDTAVELVEDIKNNFRSNELIIEHNVSPSLCLKILYKIIKVVSFDRDSITKDNVMHYTEGQISIDTTIVTNSQLKGRNKVTSTWLVLHSCRKGLGGY